jgi:hypothetical protein
MSKSLRVVKTDDVDLSIDLSRMKEALAVMRDLSSVKRVRDQAMAMKSFLHQQGAALELQLDAAELFIWAVRRVGEITREVETAPGMRTDKQPSNIVLPGSKDSWLKSHGITKMQASRWESVARVPEFRFVDYVERQRGSEKPPTVSGLLSEEKKIAREQARQDAIASIGDDDQVDGGTVTVCSIETLDLEPRSVDMIFTDPPYHDEYVKLYDRLGEVAAHALKPGGFCLAYAGKMYLPDVMAALGKHLEYFWTFVVMHPFSKAKIPSRAIFENYRPILAYRRSGGAMQGPNWVSDLVRGTRDGEHKEFHDWQQDEDAPRAYIDKYTEPGALVLDPFSGGGTTASVCKALGRRFQCFDADQSAVKLTLARLNSADKEEAA